MSQRIIFSNHRISKGIEILEHDLNCYNQKKQKISNNMLPAKERFVFSANFACHRHVTVSCAKNEVSNRVFVIYEYVRKSRRNAKSKTKETRDHLLQQDKMLGEHTRTTKRQTARLPPEFVFNIIDVTGLACYVIYREHNAKLGQRINKERF